VAGEKIKNFFLMQPFPHGERRLAKNRRGHFRCEDFLPAFTQRGEQPCVSAA
jgi:hypothetical protein